MIKGGCNEMADMLVIIPCGQGKIWDKNPGTGAVRAADAYTGSPFKVNRDYADHFADRWVILSAKYGFIDPDFMIPGPYNVTFKRKTPELVTLKSLQEQAQSMGLARFKRVVGLGGKEYRFTVEEVFRGTGVELLFPFAGLPIGKAMAAAKKAIDGGNNTKVYRPAEKNKVVQTVNIPKTTTTTTNQSSFNQQCSNNILPTAKDFERELQAMFIAARKEGRPFIDIKSGDLHKKLGGYPGNNHRMPSCCSVMRSFMKEGDQVLFQPPSGRGASLEIRYLLSY